MKLKDTIAIIPARYKSSRFPAKPLAHILGKTLIQRTYENVAQHNLLKDIYVATDHEQIYEHVLSFGGKCIMTSEKCKNGTERILEATQKIADLNDETIIVNIQGDHPCISYNTLKNVVYILKNDKDAYVATAASLISIKEAQNFNIVKCVFDKEQNGLYFSRSCIPFVKNNTQLYTDRDSKSGRRAKPCASDFKRSKQPLFEGNRGDAELLKYVDAWEGASPLFESQSVYYHVGIYAYKLHFLKTYNLLEDTPLQKAEDLEQLKILENGYKIKIALVQEQELGVDIPQDINKLELFLKSSTVSF
jgi:3-deoxy-manno-octulosonate cytidylyltransferase (CMP-KDO synthetase)